jgi:nickel transport protein
MRLAILYDDNKSFFAEFGFLLLILLSHIAMPAPAALAHNVLLSAYVEGDRVVVEGGFSDGTLCENAGIKVFDPSKQLLLEGKTDENGEFSFVPPQNTDLTVVLDAGMGHRAEYTVSAEELPIIASSREVMAGKPSSLPVEVHPPQTFEASSRVNSKEIESIVDRVITERLRPVTRLIAKSQDKAGVSPTEVFGGIGYIMGFMGIAMYVRYRKGGKS